MDSLSSTISFLPCHYFFLLCRRTQVHSFHGQPLKWIQCKTFIALINIYFLLGYPLFPIIFLPRHTCISTPLHLMISPCFKNIYCPSYLILVQFSIHLSIKDVFYGTHYSSPSTKTFGRHGNWYTNIWHWGSTMYIPHRFQYSYIPHSLIPLPPFMYRYGMYYLGCYDQDHKQITIFYIIFIFI